jgi:uncharacterized damage-inducible protein DinB
MPTFHTKDLLAALANDVNETLQTAGQLRQLPATLLNKQPAPGKWSIAQVLEHLNSYNRYYLPEMKKALKEKNLPFNPMFKAGLFGNYFTNMMQPKEGGKIANKMQAPKDHRPADILDVDKVMNEFAAGQQQLLSLLNAAGQKDIGKIKVPISISRFIKLKLGDTFRFLIAHQLRHFVQVGNTLSAVDEGGQVIAIPA